MIPGGKVGRRRRQSGPRMIECPAMKTLRVLLAAAALAGIFAPVHAQDAATDLLGRINGLRGSLGLPGYTLNGALSAAAANQAQWMASTGQISHTQADGSTPSSRAAAAGYGGSWVSENIYMGSSAGVVDAWTFWMNSPIHYRGMTNPNYQEIGIASASGNRGRAFVLVFGRVGGTAYVAPRNSSGGENGAASAPPSFVVGLDAFGNIMHEVQPEQTIGDILLTYGYTWEDLPEFLSLNTKTDADIRRLQIGEIVLVPPYGGTYTPTPYPEGWPTNTPEPEDFVATAIAEAAAIATSDALQPSATPSLTLAANDSSTPPAADAPDEPPVAPTTDEQAGARGTRPRVATSAAVPSIISGGPSPTAAVEQPAEAVTATSRPPSATPDVPPTATPTLDELSVVQTQFAPTVVADLGRPAQQQQFEDVIAVTPPGESPWLLVGIVLQVAVILVSGYLFVRGGRRR
jgi:hypothetical protein